MFRQILIVDDHEVVRKSLRSLLSSRPEWKICGEAADGLDAVEKAKSLRPDVVLMDISMPRMDGLEASRIIRREVPESKVVIVSQNDPTIVRRQAQEVDAAGYVAKSNLSRDLFPTLEKLMGNSNGASRTEFRGPSYPAPGWLAGGGEMGRLIREHDWSQTPLGPINLWPQSLKTSINLILNSQHPMWIGWGNEITFLYNDAYVQVLSLAKHPWALGKPAAEVWKEIWDICGPLADKVFQKGEPSFMDDVRLFMNRGDFLEETYYSFSYSPIRDESGSVAGLFCPSTEVTPKFLNARRLQTLSELSANSLVQKTVEAACASAAQTLAKNLDDVPFAIFYLADQEAKQLHREQTCGLSRNFGTLAPVAIDLTATPNGFLWPIDEVTETMQSRVVDVRNVNGLPLGASQQPLSQAVVLPIGSRGEERLDGILIFGVNPTRRLDAEYLTFFELLAGQVATAIQNSRASEEERKRIDSLAELDRAKTTFFSNVSHEFRTPLTLMLGPVEDLLAKSHTDLPPAAKSQLELVNRNGIRLLRLVNTLLDFSRLEAGRMQAVYQATDLAAFTTDLASVFRSATQRAGLALELDCPNLNEPVFIDRNMWEKIVLNLISNAFKFTLEGKITVAMRQSGNDVEMRVSDTGVGIPEQELPRLFDRFHRIENARSRTHEGSGIGLALVQELVKLHGGSVRVESSLGKGSTFIVSVPMGKSHLDPEQIGKTRSLASTALGAAPFVEEALRWLPDIDHRNEEDEVPVGHELIPIPYAATSRDHDPAPGRPVVLVADDNADMREYLTRLLAERYEVRAVPDGKAALESIAERVPELVLTDVMMPNLDGFGLLRELRSDPKTRTIPIILLSARAGEESRVEGMEQGADDYLIKPFSARELLARVQTHLEMARIRKQSEEILRDTKARLEATLSATEIATWTWDIQNDRVIADQNLAQLFSLSPEEAEAGSIQRYYDAIHPEDRPRIKTTIQATLEGLSDLYETDYRILRKDGSVRWVTARGKIERDAQGNPLRLPGVLIDITERKQIEERERNMTAEAIAANAKFRAVFDQTSVFAGILSLDGRVIDANRVSLEACGYRADEVLGRFFWETGWWRASAELQLKIRQSIEQAARGNPYREVLPYYWADGTERLVEFAIHPIRDNEGKLIFLHPTGVDITDLKRTEEDYRNLAETLDTEVRDRTQELEHRNAEVLRQSEQLRQLSGRLLQAQDQERRRIARELHDSAGQILAALAMNLSSIGRQTQQDAPRLVKDVDDSQMLVQQLSQEIRTMSYLLHPPLLDESGLSGALRWYIQGLGERSGLDIALTIPQDFGRLPRDMELLVFRLVQECLTNIHRHSGSKTAAIRITRVGDEVCLEVQDEGHGISPEKLSDIQSQGSGVGIRGMRERVRQFDGEMNIESTERGTNISFKLRLDSANSSMNESASEQSQAAG